MTDLSSIVVGDLLKTTYNNEPGWLLVQTIDLPGSMVSGRFLPGVGTGLRRCEAVAFTAAALTVTATIRNNHGQSKVFEALSAAVGRAGAVGLLR